MMMMMMNKTTTCLIMSGIESCDNLCAMIRALKTTTVPKNPSQGKRGERNITQKRRENQSIQGRKKHNDEPCLLILTHYMLMHAFRPRGGGYFSSLTFIPPYCLGVFSWFCQ